MFRCHPLPSYLLLVTVILATSGRGASLCRQDHSVALLSLKASFRFDNNDCPWLQSPLSSWKAGTDCCIWEGVTCDGTLGYVTALDLSGLCISGNLSSPDIFKLTSLRILSLAGNNFDASPWPSPGFEQLTDLEYLDLAGSGLSGDLPIENGQLSNLVALDLSGLDLKDLNLETLIDSLGSLQTLRLDYASMSVNPSNLARTPSANRTSALKELSMQWCTITSGQFDTFLTDLLSRGKIANLVMLELGEFDLKILSLYSLISSLGQLETLNLENVNISASIPPDLVHASSTNTMSGLKTLTMTRCAGNFPSWIFHIKSLTMLDVSYNENLCGELPGFIEGSFLQELRLSGTKLSGKIPESMSNLRNLTMLDLSNCQFNGTIPTFAELSMIQSIDLSGNNLIGSLPSDGYRALKNLNSLDLSSNSISGVLPASLFSHPSLLSLDLSQNNFTGSFLLYPNISSKLASIDLSNNKLQGPIPKLLSELVGTYFLDLSSNSFSGTVDLSFIKNCKELNYLSLSYNNKLSIVEEDSNHSYPKYPFISTLGLASCNLSYVPKILMHQRSISVLDLSNNNIGGHIPNWIWGIGRSLSINLSHNLFTSIDTNLSTSSVFSLDLHSNKIEGPIPLPPLSVHQLDYSNNCFNSSITHKFWSSIKSVVSLSLSRNNLTGEISNLICKATDVGVLDLSFNNFTGLIPPCLLEHNTSLEILNLRGNNFHGSLPQHISGRCALQIMDLNNNKLEGKVPMSLVNCHMLQVLDLGNNLIVDTYPKWLGVLPLLKVLVLKSNRFHGPINYYGMNNKQLQVLDLSSNYFNGSIPTRFFKHFKAMMVVSSDVSMYVGTVASSGSSGNDTGARYKESITVTIKGQETTFVQILSVFMSVDLSNNSFEGVIPNEIGDLKLLKGLNLSRNSFTGGIPPQIANMRQLESLDLSCNQLSGEIPPAMALMSFLEVLNLSYNHLSGMIPQSNQFLTFPETSFLGNDGLCGKPLPRLCDTNHTSSAAATSAASKELNWEFLSVEAGVVSGLVIVFATTLLWGNGRRWLYWQVDKFLLDVLQPWIRARRH